MNFKSPADSEIHAFNKQQLAMWSTTDLGFGWWLQTRGHTRNAFDSCVGLGYEWVLLVYFAQVQPVVLKSIMGYVW